MRGALCLLCAGTAASWNTVLVARQTLTHNRAAAASHHRAAAQMLDTETIIGVGVTLLGVGGGIGLIVLTENAGKRGESVDGIQICVECKAAKVVPCSLCKGSGTDPFADLVAGVQQMAGDTPPPPPEKMGKVVIDDWDVGEKEVVMYADVLNSYPVKATDKTCQRCSGRGVTVCDNCDGSGVQPRFLERYSPEDFMEPGRG